MDFHLEYEGTVLDQLVTYAREKLDPLEIKECWSVVSDPGGWTGPHDHGKADMVLIYYLSAGELFSTIPVEPAAEITFDFTDTAPYSIRPKDGDVIIFDGDVPHRIGRTPQTRVCIAFNAYEKENP